jgi:hypothetical protein
MRCVNIPTVPVHLLIRSSMCGRPDRFRSVRDLGRVPARRSCPFGIPESRSPRWLPAWLPVPEYLADRFVRCGPSLSDPWSRCESSKRNLAKYEEPVSA